MEADTLKEIMNLVQEQVSKIEFGEIRVEKRSKEHIDVVTEERKRFFSKKKARNIRDNS